MDTRKVELYTGIARSPSNRTYTMVLCGGCLGILIRRNKNVEYSGFTKQSHHTDTCERCGLKSGDDYKNAPVTINKQHPTL